MVPTQIWTYPIPIGAGLVVPTQSLQYPTHTPSYASPRNLFSFTSIYFYNDPHAKFCDGICPQAKFGCHHPSPRRYMTFNGSVRQGCNLRLVKNHL